MAGNLQEKRTTTAALVALTPLAGQWYGNTDTGKPVLGDGATAGGILVDGSQVNAQTGTSYAILTSDVGKLVTFSNSAAVAVTIAQAGSSSGAFWPSQSRGWVLNLGNGLVTITPTTSTMNGNSTLTLAKGQGALLFSNGTNYFAVVGLAGAAAHSQATPGNPSGTTSTVGLMMGLAGAITPTRSGTIMVIINGDIANDTVADGAKVQIRYGTSTAPTNGASLTGTAAGSLVQYTNAVANNKVPFSLAAVITGLTLQTAYWLDVGLAAITAGTANIFDVSVAAMEQ